ncbi:hypothetical protein VTK26DRAFT_2097 [Humicola hyalothermophila]
MYCVFCTCANLSFCHTLIRMKKQDHEFPSEANEHAHSVRIRTRWTKEMYGLRSCMVVHSTVEPPPPWLPAWPPAWPPRPRRDCQAGRDSFRFSMFSVIEQVNKPLLPLPFPRKKRYPRLPRKAWRAGGGRDKAKPEPPVIVLNGSWGNRS